MSNTIEAGIYTQLTGDSNVTDELATTTSVFNPVAPQGAVMPYVLFFHVGGGPENLTPSDMQNHVYLIKAVADEPKEAGTIQGVIKTSLHGTALTVSGFTNFRTQAETEIQLVETRRDGTLIYHRGHNYRIRIDD